MSDSSSPTPLSETILSILSIWDDIGYTQEEKDEGLRKINAQIEDVRADFISKTLQQCQEIIAKTEKIRSKHISMLKALDAPESQINQVNGYGRTGTIKEKYEEVKLKFKEFFIIYKKRYDEFEALQKHINVCFNAIGIKRDDEKGEFAEIGDKDLTVARLRRYELKANELTEEVDSRSIRFEEIKKTIYSIINQLQELIPKEIEELLNKKVYSNDVFDQLNEYTDEIKKVLKTRKQNIAEMGVEITRLWDVLNVDEATRRQFHASHTALSQKNIQDCIDEVERLTEIRNRNLPEIITRMKLEISNICDSLAYSEAQKKAIFKKCADCHDLKVNNKKGKRTPKSQSKLDTNNKSQQRGEIVVQESQDNQNSLPVEEHPQSEQDQPHEENPPSNNDQPVEEPPHSKENSSSNNDQPAEESLQHEENTPSSNDHPAEEPHQPNESPSSEVNQQIEENQSDTDKVKEPTSNEIINPEPQNKEIEEHTVRFSNANNTNNEPIEGLPTPDFDEDPLLKVFNNYDAELLRLKKIQYVSQPIIDLINQRNEIISQYKELSEPKPKETKPVEVKPKPEDTKKLKQRKSDRLNAKGTTNRERPKPPDPKEKLKAERISRRYKSVLPRIEKKLKILLLEFRSNNGEDFLWEEKPIIDELEHIHVTQDELNQNRTVKKHSTKKNEEIQDYKINPDSDAVPKKARSKKPLRK